MWYYHSSVRQYNVPGTSTGMKVFDDNTRIISYTPVSLNVMTGWIGYWCMIGPCYLLYARTCGVWTTPHELRLRYPQALRAAQHSWYSRWIQTHYIPYCHFDYKFDAFDSWCVQTFEMYPCWQTLFYLSVFFVACKVVRTCGHVRLSPRRWCSYTRFWYNTYLVPGTALRGQPFCFDRTILLRTSDYGFIYT